MSTFLDEQNELELQDFESEPEFEPEPELDQENFTNDNSSRDLAINVLRHVNESIGHVIALLESGQSTDAAKHMLDLMITKQHAKNKLEDISDCKIIEGIFNGLSMIGNDGREYLVPQNYASKSRLVEGDVLKLTIKPNGSFVFKQIAPISRKRVVGTLAFDVSSDSHIILCNEQPFKILEASVSYYKGNPGDEVIALIPKSTNCIWAAVENIIRK